MKRRSINPPQRYTPRGKEPLAVDPQALIDLFIVPASRESELIGSTCVIDVCGPLDQHDEGWCDSYQAIKARVAEACAASEVRSIVMRFDSPGGAAAGCFDAARAIRAMCVQARKPLYSYCDGAHSAAYALAVAATHGIVMSETGSVGSIGCLVTRPDYSAQNAARGVRIEFIASGARKVDGNVDAAITDDEIAATRERVNYAARLFFGCVQELRGIPSARVEALQAGVLHAEAAQRERLVDAVMSFETLLATVASEGKALSMTTAFEKARDALEEAAKGDDANAAVAKKALAAMTIGDGDGDDSDDENKDEDREETATADDDDTKAESSDDDAKAESSDDDTKAESSTSDDDSKKKPAAAASGAGATATTHSIALEALTKAHKLEAQLASDKQSAERRRLLDTRKDFDKALRTELMKASTPIGTVRRLVKELPRKPLPKTTTDAAATSTVAGTRGQSQGAGEGAGGGAPESTRARELAEMDRAMGLTEQQIGAYRKGNALCFGVVNKPRDVAANSGSKGQVSK